MTIKFDVVVVGAGILGCAAAYYLNGRGIKVALVDSGVIGGRTSGATFAWINGTSKVNNYEYHKLNANGLNAYHELAKTYGSQNIGLHITGMLEWVGQSETERFQVLKRNFDLLKEWHYPVRWVDQNELAGLEPNVRFEPGVEGLYAHHDAWLDVGAFLEFLLTDVRNNGGAVYEHCAARELFANDVGKIHGIRCDNETFSCDHVVIATGVDTPQVLSELTGFAGFTTRFPMQSAPGILVATPPVSPGLTIHHILYSGEAHDFHIRQTTNTGLLLAADDTDGLVSESRSPQRINKASRLLLERASHLIPALDGIDADLCTRRIGIRCVPTDNQSIVGPMPESTGLHLLLTHSGVTLAPILGSLMADTIESGCTPDTLKPFGFDRF